MDDPQLQAGKVANGMLNPVTVAAFTERYWTEDCQLVHPQMWLKGPKAVYMAYKLWGLLNRGKASWETSELCMCFLPNSVRWGDVPLTTFAMCS